MPMRTGANVLKESAPYATQAEAIAFLDGMDYVNDSALCTKDTHYREGKWYGRFTDKENRMAD